jgi:hypothetical protein
MSTALATKPAHVMRTHTQPVRDHAAAMQRLTDQYFAALKRAEATYFEGAKRVTDAVAKMTEPSSESNGVGQVPAETAGQVADDPR